VSNQNPVASSSNESKKWLFQFRLSTLMVGCILIAIIASYCARRYFADRHLQKTWQQCEQFLDDELLKIVSQSDAINGEVPISEMELSRGHSRFTSNGFPLFTETGFSLYYGVVFRWNGKRDEYALVSLTAILPRIGNTPEFTIRGYKGRPLDLLVVEKLGEFVESKFGESLIVLKECELIPGS